MKKIDNRKLSQNYNRNLIRSTVSTNIGINNQERLIKVYGKSAGQAEILNRLQRQSRFKLIWYIVFILLGLVCLAISPSGWVYVLDLFIVMINIDLVSRGKTVGLVVGIIECILYSFIAYNNQLYGEIIKMLVICVPLNLYTLISWKVSQKKVNKKKYSKKDEEDIVVRKLNKKQAVLYILLYFALIGICYCFLRFLLKQETALILSSVSLTNLIVNKILSAQRCMELWIVGIFGDIVGLLLWGQTLITSGFDLSQISMIVYYLACLTNDIYAYGLWKKMYRKVAVNGGFLFARRKINIKKIIKLRHQYNELHWNREVDVNKNS